VLREIERQVRPYFGRGRVANYIPALARVPRDKFGLAVVTVAGEEHVIGAADERFSVQSISKVFAFTLAVNALGAKLWKRVGREASGNPFNSLVQLEYERGIPRNPFINAGALVVTDCVVSRYRPPKGAILGLARRLAGVADIDFDREVARSEREAGHRNAALAHFLKAHGNLDNDVDTVLDAYFHQCSIAMSCRELARAFLHLANRGIAPATGQPVVSKRDTKRINALMMTCGLYDAMGQFAYRVGIPAKSGVGGGIVGVIPGVLSLAVWSPELDPSGNSLVGTKALELFTTKTRMSVF
jgi:glutaminase